MLLRLPTLRARQPHGLRGWRVQRGSRSGALVTERIAGAFDLDGTLLEDVGPRLPRRLGAPDGDDGNEQAIRTIMADGARIEAYVTHHGEAVRRAQLVARRGPICFITGREEITRPFILNALVRAGLWGALHMQPAWAGHDALRAFKAERLLALRPAFYVGDTELDREAAQTAGIPFIDALDWRRGAVSVLCEQHGIYADDPDPDERRGCPEQGCRKCEGGHGGKCASCVGADDDYPLEEP